MENDGEEDDEDDENDKLSFSIMRWKHRFAEFCAPVFAVDDSIGISVRKIRRSSSLIVADDESVNALTPEYKSINGD